MTPLDATRYVWFVWLVTWFVAALWSSRAVKRPSLRRELWYRLPTTCGALLLFGVLGLRRYDIRFWQLDGTGGWLLAGLTAAGVLFMWWARWHLGRLWSSSPTRKADHRVIDTGPYAIVRHPIYSGLLLAIGATVGVRASAETVAGAALLAAGIYAKARIEEELLRAELGAASYDAYARQVPMLIPQYARKR